jgi:Domain of unknown function (DUF4396)
LDKASHVGHQDSLNRLAFSATLHCLTGCSIGEVAGMVIGTAFGLANWITIVLSIVLAFVFGYLLTMLPLLRSGVAFRSALRLAFASDTVSITVMEIVDNLVVLLIPGAMDAGLGDWLFWGSLALSLLVAGMVSFPVVRWLIARGRGHAVVHKYHGDAVPHSGHH